MQSARAGHEQRAAGIAVERAAYAAMRAGRVRFERAREAAIRRGAAARELGAAAWWANLDPHERDRRRQHWTAQYQGLPPAEQARFKDRKAEQRQRAGGLSEDQQHQAWLGGLGEQEYHARAAERTRWFAARDPGTQRALVAAWEQHRARWAIQRRLPSPSLAVRIEVLDRAQPDEAGLGNAEDLLARELGAYAYPAAPAMRATA